MEEVFENSDKKIIEKEEPIEPIPKKKKKQKTPMSEERKKNYENN